MTSLYPIFELPKDITKNIENNIQPKYRPSCSFDFAQGDFVLDGAGAMVTCDGVEAWKQWCIKTIATTRFSCLSYSDEIGIEREAIGQISAYEGICLALEREITEALLADPAGRTYAVQDFSFARQQDGILVTCSVLGHEQQQVELSVQV